MWRMPAAYASSTAYWINGLSTTGSISFGWALVAGKKRVPKTGNRKDGLANFCDFFHRRSYFFWIECGRNETNSK
jgi:hypothetical protein